MSDINATIQAVAVYALPVVFAITLHEAAHGYVARYFGDPTAWLAGRITLNPLRHIDLIGTVIIPVILLLSNSSFMFGYAKPVPVDFNRLRHPKRDMLWVALAGPLANLLMALCWAGMHKLAWVMPVNAYTVPLTEMSKAGLQFNLILLVFNLLPLPPLDGGRVAISLLPHQLSWRFAQLERWSLLILLLVIYLANTGILDEIIGPPIYFLARLIEAIFGLY